MGVSQWMRVLDTVSGLIQMSGRFRRPDTDLQAPPAGGGPMGQLELKFTGTVDGDSISGNVQFGAFGSGTFSGTKA